MLYEDRYGNILMPDEVNDLSPWEIEERMVHVMPKEWPQFY